jgi:hypothetical protein
MLLEKVESEYLNNVVDGLASFEKASITLPVNTT